MKFDEGSLIITILLHDLLSDYRETAIAYREAAMLRYFCVYTYNMVNLHESNGAMSIAGDVPLCGDRGLIILPLVGDAVFGVFALVVPVSIVFLQKFPHSQTLGLSSLSRLKAEASESVRTLFALQSD